MILKPILAALATSALAMKLVQHLGQKHQQRRARHDGQQHREDVSRWEAEGGNLPAKPSTAKRRASRGQSVSP
jgi:hypothetical protein